MAYIERYMGVLIANFHRHSTHQLPAGKLRLTLLCHALAMIAD